MKTMTTWLVLTATAFGGGPAPEEAAEQSDCLKAKPEVVAAVMMQLSLKAGLR